MAKLDGACINLFQAASASPEPLPVLLLRAAAGLAWALRPPGEQWDSALSFTETPALCGVRKKDGKQREYRPEKVFRVGSEPQWDKAQPGELHRDA
jgi:hypothetical protein